MSNYKKILVYILFIKTKIFKADEKERLGLEKKILGQILASFVNSHRQVILEAGGF